MNETNVEQSTGPTQEAVATAVLAVEAAGEVGSREFVQTPEETGEADVEVTLQ